MSFKLKTCLTNSKVLSFSLSYWFCLEIFYSMTANSVFLFLFLLQSAKVFNYAKWEATTNLIFVLFAVIFNVTRLVYYPFW